MVPMQRVWPLEEFSVPSLSLSSSLPSSSGIRLDTLDTDDNDVGLLFFFFHCLSEFLVAFFFSFFFFLFYFRVVEWGGD